MNNLYNTPLKIFKWNDDDDDNKIYNNNKKTKDL